MKLNGLKLNGHFMDGDRPCFELDCSLAEISALDGHALTVTDDGDVMEEYFAYSISSINRAPEGTYFVWFARDLDDARKAAIEQLEASVSEVHGSISELNRVAAAAEEKAEEAKKAAEQAGASPSVRAASAMYVNAQALSNSQLSDVRDLIEDFSPGAEYEEGWIRRYEGKYYRMAQKITSTTSQTYQPGMGTESLYTLIDLAPDGIRIWHIVTDATNSFALGEKCHHPGADGPVYVSGRDGNTSEPGTDEWWTLDDGGSE